MKAYIVCPNCGTIHGCVFLIRGKEVINICFKCRYKPIRPCDDYEITAEVRQICFNCLIDLTFKNLN